MGPLGQVDERLKVAARLGIFVAVALGHGDNRIDDDETDVADLGADLEKFADVIGRIEAARLAVLLNPADEGDAVEIAAGRDEARNKRVLDGVLAAPHDDVAPRRRRAVRPLAAHGDSGGEVERRRRFQGARPSGVEVQLAPRQPFQPKPVDRFNLDVASHDDLDPF